MRDESIPGPDDLSYEEQCLLTEGYEICTRAGGKKYIRHQDRMPKWTDMKVWDENVLPWDEVV